MGMFPEPGDSRAGAALRSPVFAVAFSPDGQDGTAKLWDISTLATGAQVLTAPGLAQRAALRPIRRMPMDHETVVAYLNRVGVTSPAVSDAASLRTLHRAHQMAVPFENLSIHLAEPVSLDECDLIGKIVHRRRG